MRLIPLVPLRVLLASAVVLAGTSALAQTPAPTATAPAPAPGAPPPPAPSAATPAPATATAAPAPAPAPAGDTALPPPVEPSAPTAPVPADAPAEEEETFPAAWFRIDSDLGGLQLWAGATHMLSDTVGLATDMYVLA